MMCILQGTAQLLRYQWRDYIGECLHRVKLNKRVNLKVSTNARTSGARFVRRSVEPLQSFLAQSSSDWQSLGTYALKRFWRPSPRAVNQSV